MGEYNPKNKRLPSSWRGIQRRFPKTLSTFQIVVMAGFLSLLILRSLMGGFNISSHNTPSKIQDEEEARVRTLDVDHLIDTDSEPKRTLVQKAEEKLEKIQQVVLAKAKEKDPEGERDVHDTKVAEKVKPKPKSITVKDVKDLPEAEVVKKVGPKDLKDVKHFDVLEDDPDVATLIKKAAPDLKVVENFKQGEARLAEEETDDELTEFIRFEEKKIDKEEMINEKAGLLDLEGAELLDIEPEDSEKQDRQQVHVEEKIANQTVVGGKNLKNDKSVIQENDGEAKEVEIEVKEELTKEQAIKRMIKATRRDEPTAFTLGPRISDWDEQRADWMARNPDMQTKDPHKPRVLLLTGSQPWPCKSPVGDHYLLKMIKNKVDYARIHKLEVFYNLAHLDHSMSNFWAKLPLIRKMMLIHPEVEWIFWMDSDAMFTDMVFEIPFENYTNHNLVMWGYDEGIYDHRSWVACNTGVFFLRNNQWTLDLLETWSHMGPEGVIRTETGHILTSYLTSRPKMMADDQSALVFLMLTKPELRPKILLEWNFWLSGYWADIVGRYEEYSLKSHPGAGGLNWPFTTHFTGCQPCTGLNNQVYQGNSCLDGMERAFNFADNQVLRPFGFEHESLQGAVVKRIRNETTQPLETVPVLNPWAVESFY